MNKNKEKQISKFLSLVLRHQPDIIDLNLDENGWANVIELIKKCEKADLAFTIETLE